MGQFYRLPPINEAIQFNGTNHDEIADFCKPERVLVGGNYTLIISLDKEKVLVKKDDWVIKDCCIGFYSLNSETFLKQFKPITDPISF